MRKLDQYVTIKEAAEFLAVFPNTLRNWEGSEKIAVYRNPMNGYRGTGSDGDYLTSTETKE